MSSPLVTATRESSGTNRSDARIASTRSASSARPNASSLTFQIGGLVRVAVSGRMHHAARSSAGSSSSARNVSDSSGWRFGPPSSTSSSSKILCACAVARLRGPLCAEPRVDLVEAVVGVEDAAHDELRRHGSVPVVLLQAERHVVTSRAPVAVELGALSEGDRAARVAAVAMHAEAQMLPVTDGRELTELAARREQRDVGIGQPERRESAQLFAELERELRAARQHRVDDGRGDEVFRSEQPFGLSRESLGERLDPIRRDREAGRRAMTAEPLEEGRARTERAVQVERRNRASRALPEPFAAGDQDDRPVVALDETRGDDADHALVPVLAPDDVRANGAASPPATPRPVRSPREGSCPRPPAGRGSAPRDDRRDGAPRRRPRSAAARAPRADGRAGLRR